MNEILERIKDAQRGSSKLSDMPTFNQALEEIKKGKKASHWIWYVFPTISGIYLSYTSEYFAFQNINDVHCFLEDSYLRNNLKMITQELLRLKANNAEDILGEVDSDKLHSSMTVFNEVSKHDIFQKVLEKFYHGKTHEKTLIILKTIIRNYNNR